MRPSLRQVLFRSVGLDLNFAGGVFSLTNTRTDTPAAIPGWSFSRTDTNGTATALDLAGNVIQFPSRTNLLLQSQTFGTTWVQDSTTITSDFTAAPDGSITADRIVEAAPSTQHGIWQSVSLANSTVYSASFFAKAGERDWCYIQINRLDGSFPRAWFNLATGALGTVQSGLTASITLAANGFYRVAVSFDSLGGAPGGVRSALYIARSDGDVTFAGDITKGVYLWGAQLETGSTATAYIPTTTAAVTVVLPRITNRGILVEEARTNHIFPSIPNAATGGSNNWSRNWAGNNSTIVLNDRVAPDGTTTATRVTTTGIGEGVFYRTTTLPAANADWTAATYVYSVAGFTAGVIISHSGGTAWTNVTQSNVVVPAGVWTRIPLTRTAAASVTATSTTFAVTAPASGETFWVWSCDFGPGAFATSPIITTGAAGTRGADVASLLFASTAQGTAIARLIPGIVDSNARRVIGSDGASDTAPLQFDNTGGGRQATFNGSAALVQTTAALVAGTTVTQGVTWASSDRRISIAGSFPASDANVIGTWASLFFGQDDGLTAARTLNGYIQRVQVLPSVVTSAQLQALTAP